MAGIEFHFFIKIEPEIIIKLYKQSLNEIGMNKEDQDTIFNITMKNVKVSLIDPIQRKDFHISDVSLIETVLKEETMYVAQRHKAILEMNKKK